MKTLIAALAPLTLAAGPVFAQSYIPPQHGGYYVTVERPIGNVWGSRLTRSESCWLDPRTGRLLFCH
jgi:hypothetical protein